MKRDSSTKPATAMRCAVYTRKSTDDGLEQEFNSLDAQRESAEAYIASQQHEGWTCIPDRYDDGGFTGGNIERPALRRLIADIQAGKVDCCVVYKVDRLSRSLLDFARLMETFEKHNVWFVSVTQQFNTSHSMGRLMLNVLLSFAQFEREIIGERIRDKIAATRRKGKWSGGYPILGYDVDRSRGSPRLIINAREAARVRDIYNLYLSMGSLLPVVNELGSRGWRNKEWSTTKGAPKGGRPFDKGSLYGLLTNPLYIGQIKHKADLFNGEHELIVNAETFQKVQATLQRNGRSGGVTVRNRHGALLRGLIFCKGCGRAMVHSFTCKVEKRYRYYTCTRAISSGRQACGTGSLPALEIEKVVVNEIRGIATDSVLRAEVLRQSQEQFECELAEMATEERGLKKELAWHHGDIHKLGGEGPATGSAAARLAELHTRAALGETRLAELRQRIDEHERGRLGAADIDAAFADFDNVWNALSPREQAQTLALLVSRVEFDAADSTVAVSFHPTAIKALARNKLGGAA